VWYLWGGTDIFLENIKKYINVFSVFGYNKIIEFFGYLVE
jgi:hypothetical protein